MEFTLGVFVWIQIVTTVSGYTIKTERNRITCWTCPNKGSNLECNDWAPNRFCPLYHSVCQTVHIFSEVTGQSVRVDKRCVLPEQCTSQSVGCRTDLTTKTRTCISCCTKSYCNQDVAHDNHTAIRLSVTLLKSSASNELFHWTVLLLSNVIVYLMAM